MRFGFGGGLWRLLSRINRTKTGSLQGGFEAPIQSDQALTKKTHLIAQFGYLSMKAIHGGGIRACALLGGHRLGFFGACKQQREEIGCRLNCFRNCLIHVGPFLGLPNTLCEYSAGLNMSHVLIQ